MTEPVPVARTIVGLRREGPQAVVLGLGCGHRRHVRHRPPLSSHPWVLDDEAAAGRVGRAIECLRCGQRLLPDGAVAYRRTPEFDEASTPAGLLRAHRTRAGVWGRLWVTEGRVGLVFEAPLRQRVWATAEQPVVIPPDLPHHVEPCGPVRFTVEFLRPPPFEDG